jgi:hypothetical protein
VLKNEVVKRIFGPQKEKVTGGQKISKIALNDL